MRATNYVYDIETYPNFFCAVFKTGKTIKTFEISDRTNDLEELVSFYNSSKIRNAIGFNNVRFDAQVLEQILIDHKDLSNFEGNRQARFIFNFAQSVIEKSNNREFLPHRENKMSVRQLDVFLMNHYNNINKATSLKWVEYSMNFDKIQDLPYRFDKDLKPEQYDEVIEYCINDVSATEEFVKRNTDLIKLRLAQQAQYPELNLLNKPDSSIGETLFLYEMSKEMDVSMNDLRKMRTHRGSLDVRDLILPYIEFENEKFKEVLEFFKNSKSGGLDKSVVVDGLKYVYGEGGIHASWENRIFESNDEYIIVDLDVKSYYPNLAIVNGFRPEHLGDSFSKVFKNIYEERLKHAKGTVENQSYKIILNGVYGKLGDEYSFLYDVKPQLQICINGQLLLTMLVEKLLTIPQLTVVQCNTDGTSVHLRREDIPLLNKWWKWWEDLTGLELEEVEYSKMIINNVNNYIAVYTNGSAKYKGMYEIDQEYHKNRSQRIVKIALSEYFVKGVPIRTTIENHLKGAVYKGFENQGIFDFCLGKKVKWNQNFVIRKGIEEYNINQKVIRYYITTEKATMMKKYNDGRVESVNKGYNAKLFQNYEACEEYNINHEYYINECYKITTAFDGGNEKIGYQQKLELF